MQIGVLVSGRANGPRCAKKRDLLSMQAHELAQGLMPSTRKCLREEVRNVLLAADGQDADAIGLQFVLQPQFSRLE
eukprot:11389882-Heterocapsa_arctica.AAC.1